MVTGVVPSPPRFLPSTFIAHRVQQCHCSSIFHRVLLAHALALSAIQVVRKKKSPRIYTSMHSREFELTKLTYTRFEDNLIRHRGDGRFITASPLRHGGVMIYSSRPLLWRAGVIACLDERLRPAPPLCQKVSGGYHSKKLLRGTIVNRTKYC